MSETGKVEKAENVTTVNVERLGGRRYASVNEGGDTLFIDATDAAGGPSVGMRYNLYSRADLGDVR